MAIGWSSYKEPMWDHKPPRREDIGHPLMPTIYHKDEPMERYPGRQSLLGKFNCATPSKTIKLTQEESHALDALMQQTQRPNLDDWEKVTKRENIYALVDDRVRATVGDVLQKALKAL